MRLQERIIYLYTFYRHLYDKKFIDLLLNMLITDRSIVLKTIIRNNKTFVFDDNMFYIYISLLMCR